MLIGIDLGTTHSKVAAYTDAGRLVGLVRERTPVTLPQPGWAEHPAEELWSVIARSIRQTLAQVPKEKGLGEVRGVGVAGMAEAGLLVDRSGRSLTPLLAWYDRRAQSYVAEWESGGKADELFRTTGILASTKCPLMKVQWLRDERPEAFSAAWKWLHAPDFVVFRLTGEVGTDLSLAGRTMAFDIHRKVWCEWILTGAGIERALWPDTHLGTQAVGSVTSHAAELTGLPAGVPVVVAGHDHVCGAAAVGALEEGAVVDSLGTAESVVGVLDRLPLSHMHRAGYSYGCHVVGDKHYILGGFSGSGASVEWWLDRLAGSRKTGRYEWLLALLAKTAPGPTGVLHVPYLRGSGPPKKDLNATGALLGITENLDTGTWMKAVLEGLACEFRRVLDHMPAPASEFVTVIGGGTRNPMWMQLKADVTNRSLVVPAVEEAVTQGAAILAGVAAGVLTDPADGMSQVARAERRIDPDQSQVAAYDRWYNTVYLEAWKELRGLQQAMRSFSRAEK